MRSIRFRKRETHKRRFRTHPANVRRRIHIFRQKEIQYSRKVHAVRRKLLTKMTEGDRKEILKELKELIGHRDRARRLHRQLNRKRGRGQAKSRRARRGVPANNEGPKALINNIKRRSDYERHISRGITHSRRSRRHFFRANRFTRRAEFQQKRAKHLRRTAKIIHKKIVEARRDFSRVRSNQAQAKGRFVIDELLKEEKTTKLRLRQATNKQMTFAKKSKHH
jgi:hypothetical protein